MKLTTTTTFLLPLLATTIQPAFPGITGAVEEIPFTPADNNSTALDKRALAGTYYCRNNNFLGPCAHTMLPIGKCMNFQKGWNDNINSFGPDSGGFYCITFSNPGCTGGEPKFRFRYPGTPKTASWGLDGRISSVKCYSG